jgi:hypothetical protein
MTGQGTARMGRRRAALIAVANAVGLAIAFIDSSPGWDSTGITAGLLLLSAGAVSALGGDRPWLWALLVGLPTPAVELAAGADGGSIAALGIAAGGATVGWAIGRAGSGSAEGSLRE